MASMTTTPGMNRLLARGSIVLTIVIIGFCVRSILREDVTSNLTYLWLAPFVLGFIWILWKQVRAAKYPEKYVIGSSPMTFLILVFISIGTPIESKDFRVISIMMLAFVIVISTLERYEVRFKSYVESLNK